MAAAVSTSAAFFVRIGELANWRILGELANWRIGELANWRIGEFF